MDAGDWGLLLTLSALWSLAYLFQKIGLSELPVLSIVLVRVGIAALVLLVFVFAIGQRMPASPRLWASFALLAIFNNLLPFSLIVGGQQWVDSGVAAVLLGTTPMFSVVLSHILGGERMTVARVTGVLIGMGGLVVLIGLDALDGLTSGVVGQLLILGAALSYTCSAIFGRRLRDVPPMVLATGQITCSALIMLPIAAFFDRFWTYSVSTEVWAALIALAVVCTSVAYVVYFRLLARAGPTNMLLVTLLVPVGAIIFGSLFLDEIISLSTLVGMALIFVGLGVIDGRPLRWVGRRLMKKRRRHETGASDIGG
jgi:drug/metabolite transporter (DMT)-like permease